MPIYTSARSVPLDTSAGKSDPLTERTRRARAVICGAACSKSWSPLVESSQAPVAAPQQTPCGQGADRAFSNWQQPKHLVTFNAALLTTKHHSLAASPAASVLHTFIQPEKPSCTEWRSHLSTQLFKKEKPKRGGTSAGF